MVSHAVWKTWPSGLSYDKNLGLRPRFLSTESLGPCFSHGMGDHDQILHQVFSVVGLPCFICWLMIAVWLYMTFRDIGQQWASYQIRKIAGCACAGNAGNVFPRRRFQRKPLVSDPGMHHGTCVTHVPWCMSGSLTCGDGENVPGIPGACASAILRIWQEAHGLDNGFASS